MTELEKHIDDFVNGRMNANEKEAFEERMNGDSKLRAEVELYIEIHDVFSGESRESSQKVISKKEVELLNLLQDAKGKKISDAIEKSSEQYFGVNDEKVKKRKLIYLLLSALIIIILGFIYWSTQSNDYKNKDVYASYKDYSQLPSLTNRDDQSMLSNGENLFNTQKYEEASIVFKKFLDNNKSNTQAQLYFACCQVELGNIDEGIQLLDKLSNGPSLDKGIAKWYLALAFIKKQDFGNAKVVLEEIESKPQNYNYKEAAKLLKDL